MVNAMHLAAKIIDLLPQARRTPETTDGKQGFIHASTIKGGSAEVELGFILRDYELEGLESHGQLLRQVCSAVAATEPRAQIECTITKQYRNMRYWLEKEMRPIEIAKQAMQQRDVKPILSAVRGGTDGSQLTERGLLTPNLFTGMQNVHGPLEWISVQDMVTATEVCITLAELWTK
jgi:tripeptide aminopeptidase